MRSNLLRTGIDGFDGLLGTEALPLRGKVTLIFGPTGSGKTSLILTIAKTVSEAGEKVMVIDADAGIDADLLPLWGFKQTDIKVSKVNSLREQTLRIRELKGSKEYGLIVVDTITSHYHKQVMNAPDILRAKVAGNLSGTLTAQVSVLRQVAENSNAAVILTAHTRSKAAESFRTSELRKLAKAIDDGYIPTIGDWERLGEVDPASWLGGAGLGIHSQFRFRLYIDEDGTRILSVHKIPLVQPWAIRLTMEGHRVKSVGERFLLSDALRGKLLHREYKTEITNVLKKAEEIAGIEVQEQAETPAQKQATEAEAMPGLEDLARSFVESGEGAKRRGRRRKAQESEHS